MFRREAYVAMEPIVRALDAAVLEAHGFALGGATRIALTHGEVRISTDLDFLCSDPRGYAELRRAVRDRGHDALLVPGASLDVPREPTVDQYGIRFPVRVGERLVKVELIREAHVQLGPAVHDAACPLPLLGITDCFVEKLLASSDRGADATQFDRDLIDLAILRESHGPIPEDAWSRAIAAYGAVVRSDLEKCLLRFLDDAARRVRDFAALRVDAPDRVARGIELLASELGVEPAPPSD